MATVVLQGELARRYAGGQTTVTIEAADYRALIDALERRFPGLAAAVSVRTAVAIDGVIFQEPLLEPITQHSEVHFLPLIGGG
ncbi:MAG: MoaD/ThiS family protein [Gammaproteobacteria bacterium]|nr:MoaD/ThiS family protein [Gammaproteobacteria bacterium]